MCAAQVISPRASGVRVKRIRPLEGRNGVFGTTQHYQDEIKSEEFENLGLGKFFSEYCKKIVDGFENFIKNV